MPRPPTTELGKLRSQDRDEWVRRVLAVALESDSCAQTARKLRVDRLVMQRWLHEPGFEHALLRFGMGQKRKTDTSDQGRCWAGFVCNDRCALDRGHYVPRDGRVPSPHVSETGREWF